MFEPNVLLPEQFFHMLRTRLAGQGEKRLMAAVLEDAFHCIQAYIRGTRQQERRLYREALEWFDSDDDFWPFAFVNICHALDFDPEYWRGGVHQWIESYRAQKSA